MLSRRWILKDDTVNKERLQPEMRFFFFRRNNYFEVPTNAGGVSCGRTGRTLKRAGSGSHLDEEERTVRAPRSLDIVLSEKSISLDHVTRRRVSCPRMLGGNLANEIFLSLNNRFFFLVFFITVALP